ncbi:hypothetical protein ACFQDN_24430 [Pseudomonas asuensis]|jgi:hypothetical protein|uniref:Uncharacterized protein n=1 Tax=Pseudomonas asuensis TaxID=1825787 RepID=A0ABQ2GXQ7_9PSED|nr:hypothetical protein [Pseudomonas asuensis]GGM18824.1 hypothetical protein GCM10009425_32130 [Pseudomonas asuensis]
MILTEFDYYQLQNRLDNICGARLCAANIDSFYSFLEELRRARNVPELELAAAKIDGFMIALEGAGLVNGTSAMLIGGFVTRVQAYRLAMLNAE